MVKFNPPWHGPPITPSRRSTRYYYHVTCRSTLPKIMEQGLIPQEWIVDTLRGERVFRRISLLEYPDETGFYGDVILKVRIPPGMAIGESMYAEGFYVTRPIPPPYIEVYKYLEENK